MVSLIMYGGSLDENKHIETRLHNLSPMKKLSN